MLGCCELVSNLGLTEMIQQRAMSEDNYGSQKTLLYQFRVLLLTLVYIVSEVETDDPSSKESLLY